MPGIFIKCLKKSEAFLPRRLVNTLLRGVAPPAGGEINFDPSFPGACTSEMTLLTKDMPTFLREPIKPLVLWERRSSEVNEHSRLWGCK